MFVSKCEGLKGRHFYGRPRAALRLATPLAARTSSRTAVEQRRYAAGMADTQGWQFPHYTRIVHKKLHKNWDCAWSTQENFCFFIMWLLYLQLLGDKTDTSLCGALYSICLNCQSMTKL